MRENVYISGAIAHLDIEERKAAFNAAEQRLKAAGMIPFNPFKNGLSQRARWQDHMRVDIRALLMCDAIYMLRGWEMSKGCKLELDVASSCGIEVRYEAIDMHGGSAFREA